MFLDILRLFAGRPLHGGLHQLRWGGGPIGVDRHADRRPQPLQLVDGGGPLQVGGHQQHQRRPEQQLLERVLERLEPVEFKPRWAQATVAVAILKSMGQVDVP